MIQTISLVIPIEEQDNLKTIVAKELKLVVGSIQGIVLNKRSIDARSRVIKLNLQLTVYTENDLPPVDDTSNTYKKPHNIAETADKVIIVGAGPAGLFAALQCIQSGLRPIVIERGKTVRKRRIDLANLSKNGTVNSDSNYCFGEGGAGTYSDGKLYTRSTKRGDVQNILNTFIQFGADASIGIDAHPHIGTNKLPGIIEAMREAIIAAGGEVHFETRVTEFIVAGGTMLGVRAISVDTQLEKEWLGAGVILATGHSARDIFYQLHRQNITIEAKPFAMGVRVEHPQALIDQIQYKRPDRGPYLPPAAYNLVHQVNGRGVFSFCMCPGGIIAPCATAPGEVVTNGWSPSKRNNPYANSGIVMAVEKVDLAPFESEGVFAGLAYQQMLEKMAFEAGGCNLQAPAQGLIDFCQGKLSQHLPDCSYHRGVVSSPLHQLLPKSLAVGLQQGFNAFGQKMKGYLTQEALIVGVESRTSSPIRIPRNPITFEHTSIFGFYPCGEGAGYAGGIVSAAIDGVNCANALAAKLKAK